MAVQLQQEFESPQRHCFPDIIPSPTLAHHHAQLLHHNALHNPSLSHGRSIDLLHVQQHNHAERNVGSEGGDVWPRRASEETTSTQTRPQPIHRWQSMGSEHTVHYETYRPPRYSQSGPSSDMRGAIGANFNSRRDDTPQSPRSYHDKPHTSEKRSAHSNTASPCEKEHRAKRVKSGNSSMPGDEMSTLDPTSFRDRKGDTGPGSQWVQESDEEKAYLDSVDVRKELLRARRERTQLQWIISQQLGQIQTTRDTLEFWRKRCMDAELLARGMAADLDQNNHVNQELLGRVGRLQAEYTELQVWARNQIDTLRANSVQMLRTVQEDMRCRCNTITVPQQ